MKDLIRKILKEIRVPREERIEVYKDDDIIVVMPLTHRALQKYANKCQWCINNDFSEWDSYHKRNHVVIIQRNPKGIKHGITNNPIPTEIFVINRWDSGNYGFDDVKEILGYEFISEEELINYYLKISKNPDNFGLDIVYYSPHMGVYDMEDNFLWDYNLSVTDIPNVTPEIIRTINDFLNRI